MTEATPKVTRHDVEQLWSDVIGGRRSWQDTSARAEALVERVNSENPIVNEGLLTLYYLWQPGAARDAASLSSRRDAGVMSWLSTTRTRRPGCGRTSNGCWSALPRSEASRPPARSVPSSSPRAC